MSRPIALHPAATICIITTVDAFTVLRLAVQAHALAVAAGEGQWAELPAQYAELVRNVWQDWSPGESDARK